MFRRISTAAALSARLHYSQQHKQIRPMFVQQNVMQFWRRDGAGDRGQRTRADESQDTKYDWKSDKNIRQISMQMGAFLLIIFFSGKMVEYLIDTYMYPDASKGMVQSQATASKMEMLKGTPLGKSMDIRGNFLTEEQITD